MPQNSQSMPDMQVITIYVDGMTCAACESKIERKVGSLPGVESAQASYVKATVKVRYDAGKVSLNTIYKTIEDLDYSVRNTISGDSKQMEKAISKEEP